MGHNIDEFLSWDFHINKVISKLGGANYAIAGSKNIFPLKIRKSLYNTMFNSQLQFGILSYVCDQKNKFKKVTSMQKKCIRNVANVGYNAHTEPIFKKLNILKFDDVFQKHVLNFMHQYRTDRLPSSFENMFTPMRDTEDLNN